MILRIIPPNGGNDNVIGLERGIHYKPTSSRVTALAISFDLRLPPCNCPGNWASADFWRFGKPRHQEKNWVFLG
jgi:hypothetical protein